MASKIDPPKISYRLLTLVLTFLIIKLDVNKNILIYFRVVFLIKIVNLFIFFFFCEFEIIQETIKHLVILETL